MLAMVAVMRMMMMMMMMMMCMVVVVVLVVIMMMMMTRVPVFFLSGRYNVNVKYNDKHVPNSPFRVRAGPPFDASKVKVSGVEESPVTDEPAQVLCDCTEAGTAPLTGMDTL